MGTIYTNGTKYGGGGGSGIETPVSIENGGTGNTEGNALGVKLKSDNTKAIKFGIDGNGNYGYYKDGADTVTPFKTGPDTSDATATASDILSNKTAYVNGSKITGNIVERSASNTSITSSITYSAGYYPNSWTVSVKKIIPSWANGSDSEIAATIQAYYNKEISLADIQAAWSIGDVREVNLSAINSSGTYNNNTWSVGESHRAQTVKLQILDFNHDDLTTSINGITKALITVDQKDCLRDASVTDDTGSNNTENGYMESTNTNTNGWRSCARRKWCNGGYYQALPTYLRNLIKPVNKLTSAGNQSSTIYTDSDYIFLLSEIEIFGSTPFSKSGEGSQYAWYANATENRYKLPKWISSYVSDRWWERSPGGSDMTNFCSMSTAGVTGSSYASNAIGVAPAFCL